MRFVSQDRIPVIGNEVNENGSYSTYDIPKKISNLNNCTSVQICHLSTFLAQKAIDR